MTIINTLACSLQIFRTLDESTTKHCTYLNCLEQTSSSATMASIIKHTAFQPLLTGPLLYVLTRGSPELRARLIKPLSSLPFNVESEGFVKALKWLFALGLFSKVNGFLTNLAQNCWTTGNSGGKAWDWPNEVMAVTGGSGGLGSEVIQICAKTGMKVAIMDVSPPGAALKQCTFSLLVALREHDVFAFLVSRAVLTCMTSPKRPFLRMRYHRP